MESIVKFRRNDREVAFFVQNKSDVIQGCHWRGFFYEEEELRDISLVIPTSAIIFDIGANVGNHLVWFLNFCRGARVVPFEVNPPTIEILRKNIELNSIAKSVDERFLGLALGRSAGCVIPSNAGDIVNNLGAVSFQVASDGFAMVALDDVVGDLRPDFLKIDVEGMELDVLKGAERTITKFRPPLYVEVGQKNRSEFKSILSDWGYVVERTHQRHRNNVNYLCTPW